MNLPNDSGRMKLPRVGRSFTAAGSWNVRSSHCRALAAAGRSYPGSAALVADGQHPRVDALTSLAVLLGALGVLAGLPLADPLVGLLITVAILLVLRDAAREVWWRLMDAVDPALVEQLEAARHAMLHSAPRLRSALVHVDPCGHSGTDHHTVTAHHF